MLCARGVVPWLELCPEEVPSQEGFRPAKLFSIDRVFRNETLDATHLAEFQQIEGAEGEGGSLLV